MRWPAALVALCVALVVTGDAQQAPQPPRFKSGVEIVELDVSALDDRRHPVRGLTALDFTVLEDGQPQSIVQFTAVDIPEPPPTQTKWTREVAPDVKDNAFTDRRLFVIVLDDVMVGSRNPAAVVGSTKTMAMELVDRLGPSDLAAIVFTSDNSHAQDFTDDHALLKAAIDTFRPHDRDLGGQISLGVLRSVAEMLKDLPHQRKIVMYISVGFTPSFKRQSGLFAGQLKFLLDDLFRFARLANINVYSFDPSGLRDAESHTIDVNTYLKVVADSTGGRAAIDRNDLSESVDEMVRESGSYYLVAYQSSNEKKDGKYRKIEVKVSRPGVTVRTRDGYEAPRDTKAGAVKPPVPGLETAMSGFIPRSDVAMRVTVAPFAIPGDRKAALAIAANVRQPSPKEGESDIIELFAGAFGPEGEARGSKKENVRAFIRPEPGDADGEFDVETRLDLKPGHYNLRISAQSALMSGKAGSVYYPVDVPDFQNDPLSLSGVVIASNPRPPAGGTPLPESLLAYTPTTRRTFRRTDQLFAFFRIYQRQSGTLQPVQLETRIVDDKDAVSFHASDLVGPRRFDATRALDHEIDVPVNTLAPGSYLLAIEATAGKATARRDVRFVVR